MWIRFLINTFTVIRYYIYYKKKKDLTFKLGQIIVIKTN